MGTHPHFPPPSTGTEMYLAAVVERLDGIRGELDEIRGLLSTKDEQAPAVEPPDEGPQRVLLTEPLPPTLQAAKAAPKKTSGPRRHR